MKHPVSLLLSCVFIGMTPVATNAQDTALLRPSKEFQSKTETYEALCQRVRTEPLKELSDQWYQVLISGERQGALWLFVPLNDPQNPRTLEQNFGEWNLSARASLLLSYAQLVTGLGIPRDQAQGGDARVRPFLAKQGVNRARIRQIVKAGGYAKSWKPFVVAYRKWAQSAEAALPPGNTAEDDWTTPALISRLGQEQGVFRLVRETRIDARDVANEMLRIIDDFRETSGMGSQAADDGTNLFYLCDPGGTTVRVHLLILKT